MRWLLDKAFGGVVGFIASTLIGTAIIMLGIVPREALAEFFLIKAAPWILSPWVRVGIVLSGVTIITAAALWKIVSERRLLAKAMADQARSELKELIEEGRRFTSVTVRANPDIGYFQRQLATDIVFFKLRPSLSKEFVSKLLSGNLILVDLGGLGTPALARMFLQELDRLEKEQG